jgi:DNA repair exonuclease SbcCD nuclease subunit
MVATDIHLGYGEKKENIGKWNFRKFYSKILEFQKFKRNIPAEDSFNTFEEILELANSRNVDLILLGGDLFHESSPSTNSMNR